MLISSHLATKILRRAAMFLGTFGCLTLALGATPISIPNGNFTSSSNTGSVGGGVIGTGVSNQAIGQGPWAGSTAGVLGAVTPPLLTITNSGWWNSAGYGQISGIANVNTVGIADNGGFFSQTLSNSYQANTIYTLQANINAGSVLGLTALASQSVGIALTNVSGNNATFVASSTGQLPTVTLTLLSGYEYNLTMQYTTGSAAPSGQIGLGLFDTPSNLATANLLQSVRFDSVSLDATAVPEPASFALCGMILVFASATGLRKRSAKQKRLV